MQIERKIYDARGNGNGGVSPTITGDHQNRITDYTALVVESAYIQSAFGKWKDSAVSDTLRSSGGDIGGGTETLILEAASMWNGEDTVPTLTANNAGGEQRMPDKKNFNCLIERVTGNQNENGGG